MQPQSQPSTCMIDDVATGQFYKHGVLWLLYSYSKPERTFETPWKQLHLIMRHVVIQVANFECASACVCVCLCVCVCVCMYVRVCAHVWGQNRKSFPYISIKSSEPQVLYHRIFVIYSKWIGRLYYIHVCMYVTTGFVVHNYN